MNDVIDLWLYEAGLFDLSNANLEPDYDPDLVVLQLTAFLELECQSEN